MATRKTNPKQAQAQRQEQADDLPLDLLTQTLARARAKIDLLYTTAGGGYSAESGHGGHAFESLEPQTLSWVLSELFDCIGDAQKYADAIADNVHVVKGILAKHAAVPS